MKHTCPVCRGLSGTGVNELLPNVKSAGDIVNLCSLIIIINDLLLLATWRSIWVRPPQLCLKSQPVKVPRDLPPRALEPTPLAVSEMISWSFDT